jgi:hypothetical protein
MGVRSCIGTTDTRVEQLPAVVTPEDRRFILDNINRQLALPRPLTEADIIAERCGVRPLVVEESARSQDTGDWTSLSRKTRGGRGRGAAPHQHLRAASSPTVSTSATRWRPWCGAWASRCPTPGFAGTASLRTPCATSSSTKPS